MIRGLAGIEVHSHRISNPHDRDWLQGFGKSLASLIVANEILGGIDPQRL